MGDKTQLLCDDHHEVRVLPATITTVGFRNEVFKISAGRINHLAQVKMGRHSTVLSSVTDSLCVDNGELPRLRFSWLLTMVWWYLKWYYRNDIHSMERDHCTFGSNIILRHPINMRDNQATEHNKQQHRYKQHSIVDPLCNASLIACHSGSQLCVNMVTYRFRFSNLVGMAQYYGLCWFGGPGDDHLHLLFDGLICQPAQLYMFYHDR